MPTEINLNSPLEVCVEVPGGIISGTTATVNSSNSCIQQITDNIPIRTVNVEPCGGSIFNQFITDLLYYSINNPNQFITSGDVNSISGYLVNYFNTNNSSGVNSLNGLTGVLSLSGLGNITITTGANVIYISGNTGFLASYVARSETGNFITNGQTGNFYTNNNPSGFLTINDVVQSDDNLILLLMGA